MTFIPNFSKETVQKLIVQYERSWKKFEVPDNRPSLPEPSPDPLRAYRPAEWWLSSVGQEAEFEFFPEVNQ